ncbi:MAG: class I SAM-dependent methyltransferase [Pirellulaceae bacterium]
MTQSTSPDYREIYNQVIRDNDNYNRAENSPGFLNCVQATKRLQMLGGKSLDVGCGVGFVCQFLSQKPFYYDVHGVDVSDEAIERSKNRMPALVKRNPDAFRRIEGCRLPFEDACFSLVTCFDVMEHLDVADIELLIGEINRVTRPGGTFFGSVSCREAGSTDINGDNLHRTVQSIDWWVDRVKPDEAIFESHTSQLSLWKRRLRDG